MKKRLLIATLGTSPAVVTEAIDLLSEQGQRPDRVCIIKTKGSDVQKSYDLLRHHVTILGGIEFLEPLEIKSFEDIDTSEIAVEFMNHACQILRTYKGDYERYVCIAGGRKVMSALLAVAVKLYGAERLFHIWAPLSLEEDSDIRILRRCSDEIVSKRLHPKLEGPDRPHIVDLPLSDVK